MSLPQILLLGDLHDVALFLHGVLDEPFLQYVCLRPFLQGTVVEDNQDFDSDLLTQKIAEV